jgi:hypothetical protein
MPRVGFEPTIPASKRAKTAFRSYANEIFQTFFFLWIIPYFRSVIYISPCIVPLIQNLVSEIIFSYIDWHWAVLSAQFFVLWNHPFFSLSLPSKNSDSIHYNAYIQETYKRKFTVLHTEVKRKLNVKVFFRNLLGIIKRIFFFHLYRSWSTWALMTFSRTGGWGVQ